MKRNNLSQQQLSKVMGVWPSAVARWLSGDARPSDANIQAMAEIFGTTPQYIDWGSAESKGFSETKYQALSARDKRIVDAMLEALSQK